MRALIVLAVVLTVVVAGKAAPGNILQYVAAADDAYRWEKLSETQDAAGGSVVQLKMTSQVWQGITWTHRIAVARPAKMRHPELCFLFVTGGSPQGQEFAIAVMIANLLGTPIAVLGDIPNQPLFEGKNEDALIAYTFSKYLETEDGTWPLLFPMTKSAVRAMDALQELSENEWDAKIDGFIVSGASKRGWTTWFTGVVDARAKAIAPLVYDNLNLPAQMRHHLSQWGDYSPQIHDYTERGLPDLLASEEGRRLGALVDPYTYRKRLKMPKLIVTGTNDPYWPLDAANDYWDELVGPKYILYVPNSGHGLDDRMRVLNGLGGFSAAVAGDVPLPKLQWQFAQGEEGLTLTASSAPAPERVLLWRASAPTKDFRPSKWSSEEIEGAEGAFAHTEPVPAQGYTAFLMEFSYGVAGRSFPLSTQVRIVGATDAPVDQGDEEAE